MHTTHTHIHTHIATHALCYIHNALYTEHDGSVDAVSVSEDGLRVLVGTSSVSFDKPSSVCNII